jgi:anti-sigma factor RsiW
MNRDELEFSISQYLDGTLVAAERDALDERFATDADARAILAEYEALQAALASAPLPDVKWDRLAAEISASVAREEAPAQSHKIGRWLRPANLAIAASLLIAGGIGFSIFRSDDVKDPVKPIAIFVVDGAAPAPVEPTINPIQVVIGPSPAVQDEPIVLRYADGVVQRPSNALIVSAAPAAQDNQLTPF